jgi:hypothetical protein
MAKVAYTFDAKLAIPSDNTGATYYLEYTFAASATMFGAQRLNSGLAEGSAMPVHCLGECPSTTATIGTASTADVLTITLTGALDNSATCDCYFPVGSSTTEKIKATSKIFHYKGDTRTKNVYYETDGTDATSGESAAQVALAAGTDMTTIAPDAGSIKSGETKDVTLTIKGAASNAQTNEITIFFPTGSTFSSTPTVTIDSTTCSGSDVVLKTFTADRFFKWPGILITQGATGACTLGTAGGTTHAVKITSVTSPAGMVSNRNIWFTSGPAAGACHSVSGKAWDLSTAVNFTNVSNDIKSTKGAGPNAVDMTIVLTMTTTRLIPAGGKIVVDLFDFTPTARTSIKGETKSDLTNRNASVDNSKGWYAIVEVDYTWASDVLTITKFAEVAVGTTIKITMPHLKPAAYTTSTAVTRDFYASVKSY